MSSALRRLLHVLTSLASFGVRPTPRRRPARPSLGSLESRDTPAPVALSTTPQQFPLGGKPGDTVKVRVAIDIDHADPDELEEGEGFIKVMLTAPGFSQTSSTYGVSTISVPITQKGEKLTARTIDPPGADGDEGVGTLELAPTAKVQIGAADPKDNITLFNSAADPLVGAGSPLIAAQTIPVTITNQGSESGTFTILVDPSSGGSGTLDMPSLTLAAGASKTLTFTPNKDSAAADDVHIVAKFDGAEVGRDDMTVVSVAYASNIYNADTPALMVTQRAYRIPPRVDTPLHVAVKPDISSSPESAQVVLSVKNGNATNGQLTLDGAVAPLKLTGDKDLKLRGTTQTAPGHAAQLQLAVQVRGVVNVAHSNGFSVSAIPQNWTTTFSGLVTGARRGIAVVNSWESDSGVIADLDEAERSEVVQYVTQTGVFAGLGHSNSSYLPANLGSLTDTHSIPASVVNTAPHTGNLIAHQTFKFLDRRTGVRDIPARNSGFLITKTISGVGPIYTVFTSKVGTATTANGISSDAGSGSASGTQTIP